MRRLPSPAGLSRSARLLLLLLPFMVACAQTAAPTRVDPGIRPIDLPDLSALEPDVRGQIEAAHRRFEAARTASDADPQALAAAAGELAMVLMAYDLPAVEQALAQAEALAPDDARWPYYHGQFLRLAGRAAEAEAAYLRALELDDDDPVTLLRLAQVRLEQGDLQGASKAAGQASRGAPDLAYAHVLLGQIAAESGRADEAVEQFERALELEPEADRLHYLLAQVYRQLGQIESAEAHLARRGERGPRLPDPRSAELAQVKQGANSELRRGNALLASGEYQAALAAFEAALASEPENVQARLNLGLAQLQLGQTGAALESAERAVQLGPEDMEAWRALGAIRAAAGEVDEAGEAFDRALQLAPEDARANEGMADLLRGAGDCAAALTYYDRAIEADPATALLHVRRAMCRLQAGDPRAAIEGLETARSILPEDRNVADALARLLATQSERDGGDARRALDLARQTARRWEGVDILETQAMAEAAAGRFEAAAGLQQEAIELAAVQGRTEWRDALERNLERYRAGRPATEPWPDFIYLR